jgi:hypothetical protein
MSKSSNPFTSFSEVASTEISTNTSIKTKHQQLTVSELLFFLHNIVRNDPTLKYAPVFHIEFGALTPSMMIEVVDGEVVISG